jgi:hypothetical protein
MRLITYVIDIAICISADMPSDTVKIKHFKLRCCMLHLCPKSIVTVYRCDASTMTQGIFRKIICTTISSRLPFNNSFLAVIFVCSEI